MLHEKVTRFARSPAGNAGHFTPHGATWFNQARYLDDERDWQFGANRETNRGQARVDSALEALRRADAADAADSDPQMVGGAWGVAEGSNGRPRTARVLEGAR